MQMRRLMVYASCLDGHDPVRLFEKRMNAPKGKFKKLSLICVEQNICFLRVACEKLCYIIN